jgi:cobalt/nickel transport system ATP-binding protein
MLRLENVYFSYESKNYILENISLEFKKGLKIAILGRNGCGKTTLMLLCSGILKPKKGKVFIDSLEIKNPGLLKKHVGIVFQNPDTQLLAAKVYQDISFGLFNLGFGKDTVKEKVEEIIKRLGIEHLKNKPTQFLSYGQKRLVSIADILVMEPEYIFLDEPEAYLDYKSFLKVQEIISELPKEGKSVIISTHDSDFAFEWADYIYVIDNKTVALHGTPDYVFSQLEDLQKIGLKIPYLKRLEV